MKKTKHLTYLLILVLCSKVFSQKIEVLEKTSMVENLKKKSHIIYTATTENNEFLCVKERVKKLSSNAYYTFYHYDSNRTLIKSYELKTKRFNKIFLAKDSIYLVRYKKNYLSNNPANSEPDQMFSELKNIDFFYQSASLKNLEFKEHHWSSITNSGKHWNKNPDDFEIILNEDDTTKRLLRMSAISYRPSEEEVNLADVNITANDSLKRTKHYSTHLQLDIFDKNFDNAFSKKVILTNNIGEFYLEKYKVHSKSNSIYLLLSTFNNKKKKLISFKNKINTKYHLVKITPDSIQYKSIDDGTHDIATINMELFNDHIICAGMYSYTNDYKINGFFKLEFEKNSFRSVSESYLGFTDQFFDDVKTTMTITNNTSKVDNTNNKTAFVVKDNDYIKFKSLSSDYIKIDENGDCIINIEEYEIMQNNAPMMGMPMGGGLLLSVGMNFSNPAKRQRKILAAKISADNGIIWARSIKMKESK